MKSLFGSRKRADPQLSELDRRYEDLLAQHEEATLAWTRTKGAEAEARLRHEAADAALFKAEGDHIIGNLSTEKLEAHRTKAATAKAAVARAAAEMRQAERRHRQLESAIEQFKPELVAAKVQRYHERYRDLVPRFLELLEQAAAVGQEIHDTFTEAEQEFPHFYLPYYQAMREGRSGVSHPYPVNAGLMMDLSWWELRHNPNAQDGGRLGHYTKTVEAFLKTSEGFLKAYPKGRTA